MPFDWQDVTTQHGKAILRGLAGGSFAQNLALAHYQTQRPLLIICEDVGRAQRLQDEVGFFAPRARVRIMPPFDVLPYHGLSPHPDIIHRTIAILYDLLNDRIDCLIAPYKAILRRTLSAANVRQAILSLNKGELYERAALASRLVALGYTPSPVVEEVGEFAVRGDVIDVYSPQADAPVRLSFFDIELESLQPFDPASQRTQTDLHSLDCLPVHEILLVGIVAARTANSPAFLNPNWKSDLKRRCDAQGVPKPSRDQAEECIRNRIYFHGVETLLALLTAGETGSLFDFLAAKTLIVTDLPATLTQMAEQWQVQATRYREGANNVETAMAPEDIFLTGPEVSKRLSRHFQLLHEPVVTEAGDSDAVVLDGKTESNAGLRQKLAAQISQVHSLAPLASALNQKRLAGYGCFLTCHNVLQLERVRDLLTRFELPLHVIDKELQDDFLAQAVRTTGRGGDVLARTSAKSHPGAQAEGVPKEVPAGTNDRVRAPAQRVDEEVVGAVRRKPYPLDSERSDQVFLLTGALHEGFLSPETHQWWITDEEIFGRKTRRLSARAERSVVFSSFSELAEGDFIIHMDHGIGIYRGLVKLDVDPNQNDFLLVEYLGGDKIYVPVDKLTRVQRYVAAEGVTPMLDKLGGTTWLKTRGKAKRAARKLAAELLQLQARRETQKRRPFAEQREAAEEFATSFEFEETPDQERAIVEVAADMTRERPMDRLICGDVGYGKTEVALRAVYRAITDGRQAAVLVPTTVLAFQHFQTFSARLKGYPLRVELLSRFRGPQEQIAVVRDLAAGAVDIVIGTHRLLSKDVKFRDLGLLVVDEEHRFGVVHKERIKKLRALVDVMTLTATPIPRTLNFALSGIRDLSIINTPPVDRLAVRTFACGFDEHTVREAVLKEIRRGGQVYFVHNRVQSITRIAEQLTKLLPEARLRIGHGQMVEEELEKVMVDFMRHEFDVLLCTTIIESGLDIPNANTMFINRADMLGLSQLYQLRGRIGRSHHQAYCYLIIPSENLITKAARKRLSVIQRFTTLGSGFKVASHDLEIRGAGNILGDEQSGHIAAIGYDLYVQMLEAAIAELKDQKRPEDFEPEIQLNVAAKIPDDFIPDTQLRLILYKQVSTAQVASDVDQIGDDWTNRFGRLPPEVLQLMSLIKIRLLCQKILVSQLRQRGELITFTFHPDHAVDTQILVEAVKNYPKKFSVTRDGAFCLRQKFGTAKELIATVHSLLEKMAASTL